MPEDRVRGEVARRTEPVEVDKVDEVHKRLMNVSVALDPDPSSGDLRELYSRIRDKRTAVSRILGVSLRRLARQRADLVRFERTIEAESAHVLWTGRGIPLATNDKQRQAGERMSVYVE